MIAVVNGAYLQIVQSQNDSDIDVHESLSAECTPRTVFFKHQLGCYRA